MQKSFIFDVVEENTSDVPGSFMILGEECVKVLGIYGIIKKLETEDIKIAGLRKIRLSADLI